MIKGVVSVMNGHALLAPGKPTSHSFGSFVYCGECRFEYGDITDQRHLTQIPAERLDR